MTLHLTRSRVTAAAPAHQAFLLLRTVSTVAPRSGGWLVAAWPRGVTVDLPTVPGSSDVPLRDVGLPVAAVAPARSAERCAPARRTGAGR